MTLFIDLRNKFNLVITWFQNSCLIVILSLIKSIMYWGIFKLLLNHLLRFLVNLWPVHVLSVFFFFNNKVLKFFKSMLFVLNLICHKFLVCPWLSGYLWCHHRFLMGFLFWLLLLVKKLHTLLLSLFLVFKHSLDYWVKWFLETFKFSLKIRLIRKFSAIPLKRVIPR